MRAYSGGEGVADADVEALLRSYDAQDVRIGLSVALRLDRGALIEADAGLRERLEQHKDAYVRNLTGIVVGSVEGVRYAGEFILDSLDATEAVSAVLGAVSEHLPAIRLLLLSPRTLSHDRIVLLAALREQMPSGLSHPAWWPVYEADARDSCAVIVAKWRLLRRIVEREGEVSGRLLDVLSDLTQRVLANPDVVLSDDEWERSRASSVSSSLHIIASEALCVDILVAMDSAASIERLSDLVGVSESGTVERLAQRLCARELGTQHAALLGKLSVRLFDEASRSDAWVRPFMALLKMLGSHPEAAHGPARKAVMRMSHLRPALDPILGRMMAWAVREKDVGGE